MKIIYLTDNENRALELMAQGKGPREIQKQCILPLSGMSIFTQGIRRKTGITCTKSPEECRNYFQRYARAMEGPRLTKEEIALARLELNGHTREAMQKRLDKSNSQVVSLLAGIYAKAAIYSYEQSTRKVQLRTYMAAFHPMAGRVTSRQQQVLNFLAEGKSYAEIADLLQEKVVRVRAEAKATCLCLGLNSRGNGVQRQLIRAYLAHLETQDEERTESEAADPMNDPMF